MEERLVVKPIECYRDELFGPEVHLNVFRRILVPFTGSTVLFATTEVGTQVAIKISSKKNGAKREWVGLNKAYDAGVPVPEPLLLANDENGKEVLISKKIDGVSLFVVPDNRTKDQLGSIIRLMHRNVRIGGAEWLNSGKPDFNYYDRYLFYWLRGSTPGLGKDSKTLVLLSKLTDAMKAYCNITRPIFNHNDIHDGQVFVLPGHRLSIIDFENWTEDSQLNELATYLFHSIRMSRPADEFENFLRGYLGSMGFTETEKSALIFYLLFISARAVSFFQYSASGYLETARATHHKVLQYIDEEKLWKQF